MLGAKLVLFALPAAVLLLAGILYLVSRREAE